MNEQANEWARFETCTCTIPVVPFEICHVDDLCKKICCTGMSEVDAVFNWPYIQKTITICRDKDDVVNFLCRDTTATKRHREKICEICVYNASARIPKHVTYDCDSFFPNVWTWLHHIHIHAHGGHSLSQPTLHIYKYVYIYKFIYIHVYKLMLYCIETDIHSE